MQSSHRPLVTAVLVCCVSPVPLLYRASNCCGSPEKSDFSCLSLCFNQNNCSGKLLHKFREQHLSGNNTELISSEYQRYLSLEITSCVGVAQSVHANTAIIKKHGLISFVLLQKSSPATHAIQLNPADISFTLFFFYIAILLLLNRVQLALCLYFNILCKKMENRILNLQPFFFCKALINCFNNNTEICLVV